MVDALSRRNATDATVGTSLINEATTGPAARTSEPPASTPDVVVTGGPRTHRLETTPPIGFVNVIRESPTTRAVILGAGGLSSLMVSGTAGAANVGHTQPVQNNGPKSIVYVGMNAEAAHEVENLQGRVGAAGVTFVKPSAVQGQIKHANQTYDLNTPEGRLGFATALGLPADRAGALASILEGTDANARDEAAQLSRVFREAEKGQRTIERIVLSGHSVGSGVWGDGNGYLQMDVIGKMSLLFPRAAGQVQDLMMAACYSGGESKIEGYTAIFPNLRSVWAYDGSAPGAWSGAVPHINRWERATRGDEGDTMSRTLATNTRKGENVAVWTAVKGYDNGQTRGPIETDRASYTASQGIVAGYVSGETVVENSQTGPLRNHYNAIQRLLSRPDLPAEERPALEKERDLVIRLLYWKNVGTMFQTTYGADINAVFNAAGLTPPNFSQLSRKDALSRVAELEAKIAATPSTSAAHRSFVARMHSALVDLAPAQVPAAWL